METFSYTVTHPLGLHARPAGLLVELTQALGCTVMVTRGDKSAPGNRLMALMLLGIRQGDVLHISTDGSPQQTQQLQEFFSSQL